MDLDHEVSERSRTACGPTCGPSGAGRAEDTGGSIVVAGSRAREGVTAHGFGVMKMFWTETGVMIAQGETGENGTFVSAAPDGNSLHLDSYRRALTIQGPPCAREGCALRTHRGVRAAGHNPDRTPVDSRHGRDLSQLEVGGFLQEAMLS